MDWKSFILGLIEALNWPLFLLVVILCFKKPIEGLIVRISSLKHKETTIEFKERLESVGIVSEKIGITEQTVKATTETFSLDQLAENSPRAAIIMAWLLVEEALSKKIEEVGINPGKNEVRTSRSKINLLVNNGLLSRDIFYFYKELSMIRNDATHNINLKIDQNDAQRFIELINTLVSLINSPQIM